MNKESLGGASHPCDEGDNCLCLCPLEGVIDTIGRKWALLIVNALGVHGKLRFSQLMKELKGISPKTLADMLKELQGEGLVARESFLEIPLRVEYSLTEEGLELRKAIIPLIKWASSRNSKQKCIPEYREMPAHQVELKHEK
ncbi:MAG: winged helix-turn-helix transcriptional regulator [Candidatus Bathyarchaeia archaeon]